jgi:Fe2+ or Zn2+ uptake regulation protein
MAATTIRSLLERHGLKVTPQRMVIAEFLLHTDTHPTADEVFKVVEDRLPAISRATVYNTLNTLVEAGVLHAVSTEPGITRYDANQEPHHHFVDTATGTLHDLPWELVDQLCCSLGPDYRIADYQITFFGEYKPSKPKT